MPKFSTQMDGLGEHALSGPSCIAKNTLKQGGAWKLHFKEMMKVFGT